MDIQFPQCVTARQCLDCRGCCLFRDPSGDWSPRLTPDDAARLLAAAPDEGWRNGSDRIALRPCGDAHACSFLDASSHDCRAYASRPLECVVYPFLISSEKDGFRVYAHASCPAVAAARHSSAWPDHLSSVRAFFDRPDMRKFILRHAACFPDYSLSRDEVEEVHAFDPAAALWRDKPRIEQALVTRPRALSAHAFVSIFAWQDFFEFDIQDIAGALCVFATQPVGTFLYLPPLGARIPPEAVAACFERMRRLNRGGSLTRIENVPEHELGVFDERAYRYESRGHEYVYARADIAGLRGNGHKSRRHDLNVFLREHDGEALFRPYVPADFNACAILFDRWLDGRRIKHDNEVYCHMLRENRDVHRLVLAHAGRLGLVGRVVEVDGRIVAYTFGYALDADTFCVLFEVADLAVKGLPAFVFSRFCADEALRGFRWINAMDDFQAPWLAQAKMLWRPARLEAVYAVMPRER